MKALTRMGSNETPVTRELFAGVQSAARFQPKASAAYTISAHLPLTFYVIIVSGIGGFFAALNYRHASNYRLDGEDVSIRAVGLDVIDFSMRQRIRSWVDFNLSIDNLTNKKYFETQNFFESRITPGSPVIAQIHATPGYSIGFTAGLTFRFGAKK